MKFKVIKFPGEKTTFIAPTWDEMNQLAFEVSQKIIKDKKKFDRIVTLAKGGWPMTRSMVDFLSVDKVASIGVCCLMMSLIVAARWKLSSSGC